MKRCYRPQRSCGQGNVFTDVCLSTGGRVSASVHAGMPETPLPRPGRENPPRPGRENPPDQAGRNPPQTRQGEPPQARQGGPPGKQTPEYGLRVAGTHPTGMHSCFTISFATNKHIYRPETKLRKGNVFTPAGFPLDLEIKWNVAGKNEGHLENLEISWNFEKFNKYHG